MIAKTTSTNFRALPLRGSDYRLDVDRFGSQNDLVIEKRGSRVEVDAYSVGADLTIDVTSKSIDVDAWGVQNDVRIEQRGDRIEVDRYGAHNDATITFRGNVIDVDRSGSQNDVSYKFSDDKLEIDRQGSLQDLNVTRRGDRIEFDRYGSQNDVTVTSSVDLDPAAWEKELGLDSEGWSLLRGWFDAGSSSIDDLVVLSETGQVSVLDTLLR